MTYNNYDFDENGSKTGNMSIHMEMANKNNKQIYLPAKTNIKYVFSKPHYIIDDDSNFNDSLIETEINKVKQCKICWIFKKPTCKGCVTRSNDGKDLELYNRRGEINYSHNTTEKKPCKFCWIFNNNNCDICQSSRKTGISFSKMSTNVGCESEVTEINLKPKKREDFEGNLIIAVKATPNNIITEKDDKPMKRKISDSYKMSAKKAKWQCNICLTINTTNRETCMCCEHYVLDSETSASKFNWGHHKIFVSNFGQKVVEDASTFTDNINFSIVSEVSDLDKTYTHVNNNQDLSFSMVKENEQLQIKIFDKVPFVEDMDISENIVRDVNVRQTIDQELGKNMNNNNTHQANDLNFLNSSFDNVAMDFEDISKKLPLMLQFNIGKGPQNEKKILGQFKRPLRRTAKK